MILRQFLHRILLVFLIFLAAEEDRPVSLLIQLPTSRSYLETAEIAGMNIDFCDRYPRPCRPYFDR